MASSNQLPRVNPCFVTHNLALGGAQTAVLRYISALPEWVRERTTLYSQSDDMPLMDAAEKSGFSCGSVTREAPSDPSSWFLSYGDLSGLPKRPTSLVLHSWDDAGWRFINRAYDNLEGMKVAGVSQKVLDRYAGWAKEKNHDIVGVMTPPVSEFTSAKGNYDPKGRLVVAWMGRPLESKGIMTLPYLLKEEPRMVIRAWTGADTAGLEYTQRTQAEALAKVIDLASKLGVADRLDIRPLDFNPFNYKHRLEGCHALLGNSEKEGYLLTAAEALSCGIPVVVTKSCGIADIIKNGKNGYLIDWNSNAKKLAKTAHKALLKAANLSSVDCLASAADLSLGANYATATSRILGEMTGTSLHHPDADVTVGLRIHKGTDVSKLDDAVSSLANQTYKKFKVKLLVDGPWSFAEPLAKRYGLPLICTGLEPDIEHCSWLHRQAVEVCDTEFYKPLDYDDQIMPTYLERAVHVMEQKKVDVYGCLLLTLENGTIEPRLHWPNKGLDTMFTGNSDNNMLPHSSVLMRAAAARKAGNYQERAVGLGADDYHLWYRIHQTGGTFFRDDEVRNVVYRIHEANSLKIRRARFGDTEQKKKQNLLQKAAAAAGITVLAGSAFGSTGCAEDGATKDPEPKGPETSSEKAQNAAPEPAPQAVSASPVEKRTDPPHS
ncbi:MAG: glycosyltransferase [Verrucomicrobiales bacterium]|nr:glycosyltransferase [Verrucomicrobiales bacterium]